MVTGAGLCTPPVTLLGCGPGVLMATVGAAEASEAVMWLKDGDESSRGFNILRDTARDQFSQHGLNPQYGESVYYTFALASNLGAAFATVTRVVPTSAGWLTTTQPRLDTLGNFRADLLGASAVSNAYHVVTPEK